MSKLEEKPKIILPDIYGEVEPFSISFIDWVEQYGFFVRDTWDNKKNKWGTAGWLELQPIQKRIFDFGLQQNEDHEFKYSTLLYSTIKKSGKALALDTPIPIPTGWTTMGELKVGDVIFDDKGNQTKVTYTTEEMIGHPCYRVMFSNDTEIIADAEHIWTVNERNQKGIGPVVDRTTKEMYEIGVIHDQSKRYSIKVDSGLDINDVELPIDPYLLGAWLGNGDSNGGKITCGFQDVLQMYERLADVGFPIKLLFDKREGFAPSISFGNKMGGTLAYKKTSLTHKLRELGVRNNKHIPQLYLRGSREQRVELLRGLMDTDGYVSIKGRCEYTTIRIDLAYGIKELLRTLGVKSNVIVGKAMLNGRFISWKYRIHFTPDFPVFNLKRKLIRQVFKGDTARSRYVRVTSIEPVESIPVRCIEVDSPSHLYLAGEGMIPTHNTLAGAAVAAWYSEVCPAGSEIYLVANDLDQAEGRMMRDLKYHMATRDYKVNKYAIELPNGTTIQALAQSYKSVAGSRHALVLFEEIWAITTELTRRTYEEMTPIPTIPWSLRFIATYAGFIGESDLLWDLYLQGVGRDEHEDGKGKLINSMIDIPVWESNKQFTYWNHEPIMPWQNSEYYVNQRATLRPAAYLRLHENRWVTTHEEFIPMEWWDYAAAQMKDSAELWLEHPYRKFPMYIGVDAAPKKDSTAVVACCYDPSKGAIIDVLHKIWTPSGEQLDFDMTLKAHLVWLYTNFNVACIAYDPAHLYQLMLQLGAMGYPTVEYGQTIGNMVKASQNLYDLLKFRRLYTYKDDEARTHVQNTVAQSETAGFRIVKQKGTVKGVSKPMDYTVALSIAAYKAVEGGGVDVSIPLVITSPFSDMQATKDYGFKLPFEFRSD